MINSVTKIANLVKNKHLNKDGLNIVVAKNQDNDVIIQKLGVGCANDRIMLKGEVHKMVAHCSSTADMGVDCYSIDALFSVIWLRTKNMRR